MSSQLKADPSSEIIDRIASSTVFKDSETLVKLLRYLAEKSCEDSDGGVKEYQIATEAFGRSSDFDPRVDSYVRTQVTRLRSKLLEYNLTEGVGDPLMVQIPKGAYRVIVIPSSIEDPASEGAPEPVDGEAMESEEATPPVGASAQAGRWQGTRLVLAIVLLAMVGGITWFLIRRSQQEDSRQPSVDPLVANFWKGFASDGHGPLVVYSNSRFKRGADGRTYGADPQVDPPSAILDHYTGVGEVLAVHELDKVFIPLGIPMHITRGALLSLDDARNSDLIWIGSSAEGRSVNEMVALKEFAPSLEAPNTPVIRNLHPHGDELEFYKVNPELPVTEDYAIISRTSGLGNKHKILYAAGTNTLGTEAAIEYLCDPATLKVLLDKLAAYRADANFEALLHVKVARGVPVSSSLVVFRALPSTGN